MKKVRFQLTGTIPALGSKTDEDATRFFNSPTGQEMIGEVMAVLEPKIIEIFDDDEEADAEGENAEWKYLRCIETYEEDGEVYWTKGQRYIARNIGDGNWAVANDFGKTGCVGPSYMADFDEVFVMDDEE